VRYHGL